jgi:antitoxin MazE
MERVNIAKVSYWGNTPAIHIPMNFLEKAGIKIKGKVSITSENEKIVISKYYNSPETLRTVEELFKDFSGEYEPISIDWGEPVGEEIW